MSNPSAAVTLRRATSADDPFLRDLFRDVHAPEFAGLPLAPDALLSLLDMQFRGQSGTYTAQFPSLDSFLVESSGTPIGRLLVHTGEDAIRLVDIALMTPARAQGNGTAMLQWLIAQAEWLGLPIRLQLRCGNPAQRLYERHGFARTGSDGLNTTLERAAAIPFEQTLESFSALTGRMVHVLAAGGIAVVLRVETVRAMSDPAKGPALIMGDSFSVGFIGPRQPELAPGTVRLITADRRCADLYLSAVGLLPEALEYEATFNRSRQEQ